MEAELAVEPQLLKKLSFKSLKRSFDLFYPLHGQFPPSDPKRPKRCFTKSNIANDLKTKMVLTDDSSSSEVEGYDIGRKWITENVVPAGSDDNAKISGSVQVEKEIIGILKD
ncbi:Protein pleiotropic regulatory locus 1-like [Forsythia ovata]|uniref:Protein pleiotropic regulatory locus 1-like n=1 Tax=Forsythia ovata TaxID=205694 RepID=A0ABD1PFV2_9LAMI